MGVALSLLMSCWVSVLIVIRLEYDCDLLQCLVVDKACGIFWYVQLALLDVFAELPEKQRY